jgi:hypothetical protein
MSFRRLCYLHAGEGVYYQEQIMHLRELARSVR